MPLVSALAASHAPNILLEPGREWEDLWIYITAWRPPARRRPTLSSRRNCVKRLKAFAVRADLEQAKLDVLIAVANDQLVNFSGTTSQHFCHCQ
jgi:hypothetical protein